MQGGQLQGGTPGLAGQPGQGVMGAGQNAGDPRGMPGQLGAGQGGQDQRGLPGQGPSQGLLGAGKEARAMQGQGPPQGGLGPGQGGGDPRGMLGQGPQGLQGPGQGLPSQGHGPQAGGGMTTSQAYNTSGSMTFSSGKPSDVCLASTNCHIPHWPYAFPPIVFPPKMTNESYKSAHSPQQMWEYI